MTGVRYRALVVAVVIGAVVACLGVLESQRRHPEAFAEAGGWGFRGPGRVGEAKYVGMSYDRRGEHGTVTIHEVSPDLVENTSAARFRFFVCRVGGVKTIGAIGIVGEEGIANSCLSLEPAGGAELRLGRSPMDQIVMAVTPMKPGRVRIRSLHVTYSRGWQSGTQTIGGRITLRTS